MMVGCQLISSSVNINLNLSINYMNGLHLYIIKDLNFWFISPKGTPLFLVLILTAKVPCIIILVMSICCLLFSIVPFYCSIAVACHEFIHTFGFPFQSCTWIPWESGSISDIYYFSLIDIVDFDLTIWTSSSNILIAWVDFQIEDFSMNVAKKVDYPWFIIRKLLGVKFYLTRIEVLFLLNFFSLFEEMLPFFCRYFLLILERGDHYFY